MPYRNKNDQNSAHLAHSTLFGLMIGAQVYLRDMENGMIFSAPIDAMFTTAFYIAASYTLNKVNDNSLVVAVSLGATRAALNGLVFSPFTMFGRGVTTAFTSGIASVVTDVLLSRPRQ